MNDSDPNIANLPTPPIEPQWKKDDDRFRAGQRLHQSSISPINNNDHDRWVPAHSRLEPQAAYGPSPELHNTTSAPRDDSITATDVSSNRAGLSTPESQQTSNTSYRESVHQSDNNKAEQKEDETFYWHSGRSSSDAEEDNSRSGSTTATPGRASVGKGSSIVTAASTIRQDSLSLPVRSSSKAPSPNVVPYGASALGFGGPSDWEYFGDYEAEEVDDEDLYAKSAAPAELPAELTSTTDGSQDLEEAHFSFEIAPPLVPSRTPAQHRSPISPTREESLERATLKTGDYATTRLRMSSVQSPTRLNNSWNQDDRPISYYQRPDLDDVIRAWSEAPYVGVDRAKDANSGVVDEDEEVEVDRFPEASLASTPQDRFLGIDLILKDAPEMPKLPDSVDQSSPLLPSPSFGQQKFDKVSSGDKAKTNVAAKSTSDLKKRFSKQLDPVLERETEAVDTSLVNGRAARRSSIPPFLDRSAIDSSVEVEPKGSRSSGLPEGRDEERPKDEASATDDSKIKHVNSQGANTLGIPPKGSLAPLAQKSSRETLQTTRIHASEPIDQENVSSAAQTKQQNEPDTNSMAEVVRSYLPGSAGSKLAREVVQKADIDRPLYIRKFSREDVLTVSDKTPKQVPPVNITPKIPEEKFEDAVSNISSAQSSQENLKPPRDVVVKDEKPDVAISSNDGPLPVESKKKVIQGNAHNAPGDDHNKAPSRTPAHIKVASVSPGDKVLQQGSPKSAKSAERAGGSSAPTSPKAPNSPRVVKVNDPYADLDPWGKASLNRFAAMLREEARVESNRDKLNIFNVFTSRESRLRVVLYGSDDELILSPNDAATEESEHEPAIQSPAERSTDEEISDEQPINDQSYIKPTIPQQEATEPTQGVLTPEEQKAIENKLATQIAAEEGPPPNQKPVLSPNQDKKNFVQQAIERANAASSSKALPALPPNRDSIIGLPAGKITALDTKDGAKLKQQSTPSVIIPETEVDSPLDDVQYSPGGRPVIPELSQRISKDSRGVDVKVEKRASKVIDGNSIEPEQGTVPEARPRPRPKAKEGQSEVNNYLTNRRSVYRPFASQTLETIDNDSNFGRKSTVVIDSTPMPLLRAPSSKFSTAPELAKEVENLPEVVPEAVPQVPNSPEQADKRRFVPADFDPLHMVLPESEAEVSKSNRLQELKDVMEAIPEDFTFIHASVVAWDANVRVQREGNDRLRHERQAESEKRIDSLFDDHEIGYGDISELEAEFKRSEAARKADEDRSEYQTFVSDVFELVWTRLHYELDQLVPHYERYSVIMDETLAGKDMFDTANDSLALAPTMSQLLALHQKIEIRHQKAFEAVLERDRRLKKTEISPWYTLNNIPKVKQLEKQFEDAERRAIIDYCEQRDERANQLMDVLDQNTLRGVGANQDYMEAIMKAVRRIASGRAFASEPGIEGAAAGLDEVQKAQTLTALLATSSEQIVQTFHVADMLLNSADYEVSVAKAKVARVDMATLVKLKEERAKEDQKLMRDLEHRLALIREDSRRTNDEIIKLMLFLGVHQGRAQENAPRALGMHMRGGSLEAAAVLDMQAGPANDPEHQERMRKALEEAKQRNALKESSK